MAKSKKEIFEWVKAFAVAIILAFMVRAIFLTPIVVDGASMNPTLHHKDRMLVTKMGEPKRFDIVVFHAPDGRDYIKRVIGLPGDQIEYKNDILYINGKVYEEPYLEDYKKKISGGPLTDSFTLEETAVGRETVPKGHLFVLGDNRQHSTDSREIGAIPLDKVIGKTKIVYYPFKEMKIISE